MNELQKIIEGFKKAEEACRELSEEAPLYAVKTRYDAKIDTYREVVAVLEDFLSKHSIFCINVDEVSAKVAEGYQEMIRALEEERSN